MRKERTVRWANLDLIEGTAKALQELEEYVEWRPDEDSTIASMARQLDTMFELIAEDLEETIKETGDTRLRELVEKWR